MAPPSTSCRWFSAIRGENSGTGVCFTRDPSTGEKTFYGDFLINAQGEDVVAGIRTPMHLDQMAKLMPKVYKQLERARQLLEKHYRDMQDMEFTVEEGKLYMLQTRNGKRTPTATFRIAVDMVNEGLITREEALERITSEDIERLFYPVIDPSVVSRAISASASSATGINAVPGAAVGKVVFTAHEAEDWAAKGEKVILVRARNQPGRRRRHGRGAGNPDGDRRQDQPRRRGRARLGQMLHRRLRKSRH